MEKSTGQTPIEPRSPADYLANALAERIRNNSSYSVRAFARDLSVSPAFISMVLNRKKNLSIARAQQIPEILMMEPQEKRSFLRSVAISSMARRNSAQYLRELLDVPKEATHEAKLLQTDVLKVLTSWYHIAILDFTSCQGFISSTQWVSHKLGISSVQVRHAVDRLQRLGLIQIKGNRWVKKDKHLNMPTAIPEEHLRKFHEEMIDKAKDNLSKQSKADYSRRDISAATMAIDPKNKELALRKIQRFHKEMAALLTEGTPKEVYQLNIQFFPLTTFEEGEKSNA